MEKVELIKFQKKDACFVQKNFPSYFKDNSIENIERIIEGWQNALCFCIVYEGEKVGIITLGEKQDRKLSWGVMIAEKFRRKGIALRAFELIKRKAQEKGYAKIISSCSKDNVASKNLHKKAGFRLIKEEINAGGFEMCRWELDI